MTRELITERSPFTPAQLYRRRFGKDLPSAPVTRPEQRDREGHCVRCGKATEVGDLYCSRRCEKLADNPQ